MYVFYLTFFCISFFIFVLFPVLSVYGSVFFFHYQLINMIMISSLRFFSFATSFTDEETPPELFRMRSQSRPVGKYHKFRWKFNWRSGKTSLSWGCARWIAESSMKFCHFLFFSKLDIIFSVGLNKFVHFKTRKTTRDAHCHKSTHLLFSLLY